MEKTRVELFEMVWQTPMIHLAKQLNISDVGLKKICQKHSIPRPSRGHWIRKDLGQEDPRPELPYKNHNPAISFPDEIKAEYKTSVGKLDEAAKHQAEATPFTRTTDQLHDIRCIRTAEAIHEFIKELEKKAGQNFDSERDKPAQWPPTNLFSFSYFYSSNDQIPIVATSKNAIRALCIADEIIERLEKQGIEVVLEPQRRSLRYEMIAKKDGASCGIDFRETYTKASKTTALTKLYKLSSGRDVWRDYIEVPKNVLCITVGGKYGKIFGDTRLKLEHQIDKVFDHIVWKLDDQIQSQKERRTREIEYERKKAIRQYNERILADQDNQFEIALDESKSYFSLQRLHDYLLVVQDVVAKLPEDKQQIGKDWIELVRSKMNDENPISRRIEKCRSLLTNGAEKSGQYWREKPLQEDYDPEFEDELCDEQDL